MAFIPVANTAEVHIRGASNGQRWENTLYFFKTSGWDAASMEVLANSIALWWSNSLSPHIAEDVTVGEIYVVDLSTATSPTFTLSIAPPLQGQAVTTQLPNNAAFVVSFRTAGRGRSSRGRNYIIGLGGQSATADPNIVNTTWAGNIVSGYEDLFGILVSDETWVVVSRYFNNAPRLLGLTQPVTAVIYTDLRLDSQRRRLPGRGQ